MGQLMELLAHVRFGSKADSCSAAMHVRHRLIQLVTLFMPQTIRGALRGLFGTSIRRSGDEIVRPAYLQ
jgi:hypothetical protein